MCQRISLVTFITKIEFILGIDCMASTMIALLSMVCILYNQVTIIVIIDFAFLHKYTHITSKKRHKSHTIIFFKIKTFHSSLVISDLIEN